MDSVQIFDIYDIWYQPPWYMRGSFLITLLISFGLLMLVWYVVRKRSRLSKPYWQETLDQLARLETKNPHEFYFLLTTYLKHYLSRRYQVDITSKTDEELVNYLEENKNMYDSVDELKKIFNETTAIKFARKEVAHSLVQEHHILSITVVKNTLPKEAV